MVGTYNLMAPQYIPKRILRPKGFTRLPRLASKMMLGEEVYAQVSASRKLTSNRNEHFSSYLHKKYFSHILGSRYIFTNDPIDT